MRFIGPYLNKRKVIATIWVTSMVMAFISFIIACVAAERLRDSADSVGLIGSCTSFVAVWTALVLVTIAAVGTFIIAQPLVEMSTGLLLGIIFVLCQEILIAFVWFLDVSGRTSSSPDSVKQAEQAMASFAFILFINYGCFGLLLYTNKSKFISNCTGIFPNICNQISNRTRIVSLAGESNTEFGIGSVPRADPSKVQSSRRHESVDDPMMDVLRVWDAILPSSVTRGSGECPIMMDDEYQPLYAFSSDCAHGFGEIGLKNYIAEKLNTGPFPLQCPICAVKNGPTKAFITRGIIKGLATANIITVIEAQRLLLQQILKIPDDEETVDYQYRMSKGCPFCGVRVAHYKGHGCHHIKPGRGNAGGCPSCHMHFCYVCLVAYVEGEGCPNRNKSENHNYCNADCGCPTCPECRPGTPCNLCEGVNGACPVCNPTQRN